jgi:hypothetical protein
MSPVPNRIIQRLRVRSNPLIPYQNSLGFVSDPTLEISSLGNVIKEEFEDTFRLFGVVANDFAGVYWIDI